MNDKKKNGKSKKAICIGILIILFIIFLRFIKFYLKSDGFSGISILLPLFAFGGIIFAVLTSSCFAAWVYTDCKKRNDDGILWAVIVFFTTPFIGLLVYFIRRSEIKQICLSCRHFISLRAKYCEECGSPIEQTEDFVVEKRTHHLSYIIAGIICTILMISCLASFAVSAAVQGNINHSPLSSEKVWNTGVIHMSSETTFDGVWKLTFNNASDGFIKQKKMEIKNATDNLLYADIQCELIPKDSTLTLWLVQGDTAKSIDVTNLKVPLEYSLSDFENGKISVRLQINGVENVSSEIYIK